MFRLSVRDVVIFGASLAALASATALLRLLPGISPATAALSLLLVVLAAATAARLWIAISTSVVATLVLNFFFLPPIGRFTIAGAQNWIALAVFLIVAIVASNLSAAAQARAREAIARRNEVTRLFDLTRDVLLTTEPAGALDALARHVGHRFDLSRVAICLADDQGWHVHQGGSSDVQIDDRILDSKLAKARGPVEVDAHPELSIVPLRHGTVVAGLLAVDSPGLDAGTLDALAGVVAIAIERSQFLREREAAEVIRQKADLAATLLASLSHDLRTPLTAIRTAVENLRSELPAEERQTQVQAAMSELDRLTQLFQDILDMARIDSAAIRVERQWVSAADVVDAAIAYVRRALDGHPLKINVDTAIEVEIDPKLTSVALSHILENAAQYSPAGGDIELLATVDGNGLCVSVWDHGPGLDPSEIEHLFERFYRGRSVRKTSFGTGMGLSITRGLLASAGGRVWAENVPRGGARFSMLVPGAVRTAKAS